MTTAAIAACCTLLALAPLRRPLALGVMSFLFGFVLNELPFVAFCYLLVSTLLAIDENGAESPGGWAAVGLAVVTTAGLVVVARRGLRTGTAVDHALSKGLGDGWRTALDTGMAARPRRSLPFARILFGPFFFRRRDVERIANISYGNAGRKNLLDVYRQRSRPSGGPVLVHLHGGALFMGKKNRESLPLLYRLAAALTPNDPAYQPGFEHADTSISAAICLHGYYGHPDTRERSPASPLAYDGADAPAFFVAHGDQDTLVPVEAARLFVERMRSTSSNPVVYVELPGAQHGFDRFHSLRFDTVVDAIDAFAAWIRSREEARKA